MMGCIQTIMSSNSVGQTDYVSMYVIKRVRHFAGALWTQRPAWWLGRGVEKCSLASYSTIAGVHESGEVRAWRGWGSRDGRRGALRRGGRWMSVTQLSRERCRLR